MKSAEEFNFISFSNGSSINKYKKKKNLIRCKCKENQSQESAFSMRSMGTKCMVKRFHIFKSSKVMCVDADADIILLYLLLTFFF